MMAPVHEALTYPFYACIPQDHGARRFFALYYEDQDTPFPVPKAINHDPSHAFVWRSYYYLLLLLPVV